MEPLTEKQVRQSFVNCSKGEAKRLPVPNDLASSPWPHLDFLGWGDLAIPGRRYLVIPRAEQLLGFVLHFPQPRPGPGRRQMCSICYTTHTGGGVSLMTAQRASDAGRKGDSVGTYMCTDLACSLYIRGKKKPEPGGRFDESLTLEEKLERARGKLFAFVDSICQ